MEYTTLEHINTLTDALLVLIPALLTVRVLRDFLVAYQDEDMGLRTAVGKAKKRIFATVIAITASSIIGLIKTFY